MTIHHDPNQRDDWRSAGRCEPTDPPARPSEPPASFVAYPGGFTDHSAPRDHMTMIAEIGRLMQAARPEHRCEDCRTEWCPFAGRDGTPTNCTRWRATA